MAPPARRGVSEVYSALLVLLIAVGVTAAVYAAAGSASRGVEEAGLWVARLASDSASPVLLVPEQRNGDLWVAYESLGSPVSKIIVIDPASGKVVAKVAAGGHKGEVLAVKGYDCRPVAIAAVLESGAVKVYDARLDPRFAGAPASPYYSCKLSETTGSGNIPGSTGPQSSVELSLGRQVISLVDYAPGPQKPSLTWRQLQQPEVIDLLVFAEPYVILGSGQGGATIEDACSSVSVQVGNTPVTLEPYTADNGYGVAVEGYRGLVAVIDGVNVYFVTLCDPQRPSVLFALEAESPARLSVTASYEMIVWSTEDQWNPTPTSLYLIAPGNVNYTATSIYEPNYRLNAKRLTTSLEGSVETVNGRVILAGAPILAGTRLSVKLQATITVEALAAANTGSSAVVSLPPGPLRVAIAGYSYDFRGSSYEVVYGLAALQAFLEKAPSYYLNVSTGTGSAEAPLVPGSYYEIPRSGVEVSIVIAMSGSCAPVSGAPVILSETRDQNATRYTYGPDLTPTPLGACKPHIIIVENDRGITVMAVEPYSGAPNIVYLGQEWEALAPVISGLASGSDTFIEAAYQATLALPPEAPIITVSLANPPAQGLVSELPSGLTLAILNEAALAVYTG